MGRTPFEWRQLAKRRLNNILRVRRICSEAQLEAKICEAGPPNDRPQPGILKAARRELVKEKKIKKIDLGLTQDVPFYILNSFDKNKETNRYNRIKRAYEIFLRNAHNVSVCGNVAEGVVYQSILHAGSMNVYGNVENKLRFFNGKEVLTGPLDFIICDKKSGINLGVEVKNRRRWYHWRDDDLWKSLAKCVSLEVLPVFLCRKFEYMLYNQVFSVIGCFGFKLHNQYFHPSEKDGMQDVFHKDGLGFADIRFPAEVENGFNAESRFIKYFRETVPKHIKDFYDRYQEYLPILKEYLVEKRFWEKPFDWDLFETFLTEAFDWYERE